MNHWWRAYNEAVNDPKLQLLSDALFRAWFNVMCIASSNDGNLPPLKDIAFTLRVQPTKAAQVLAQLHAAGLLDKTETGFTPHNWNGRQYKSDVSTERVKRFRQHKRNVSSGVSETPPDTETDTETEKIPEANASGAAAPDDPRTRLFRDGLAALAEITGKGKDACRSFVGKCLQAAGDDAVVVLGLIDDAKRNRVVNPSAWIAARLKPSPTQGGRPLTVHQQRQLESKEALDALRNASRRADFGVHRHDTGDGQASLRGGVRGTIIDLSPTRDRDGDEPVQGPAGHGRLSQPGKVSGAS